MGELSQTTDDLTSSSRRRCRLRLRGNFFRQFGHTFVGVGYLDSYRERVNHLYAFVDGRL